jgi:hypothetical protein
MTENFNLLGDPIPENWGKRGRPPHIPTERNRNKVMMLLAFGWNTDRIAKALSITAPTLRKNYFRELKVRLEARDRMFGSHSRKKFLQRRRSDFSKVFQRNQRMRAS